MLKSLVKPEINEYISKFLELVNLLNESASKNSNLAGGGQLADYISLLKFKIETGLMPELKIDPDSGMVSFGNISDLAAEKNNLELKLEHSFTPEKIRDQLMKKLDSLEEVQDFDFSRTIASLANRHYLSMLQKARIGDDILLDASLAESGDSDLIRITASGYCLTLSAFCSYEMDLYSKKKRFGKNIKINSRGEASLPAEFRDKIFGWFGVQSNIIYECIRNEKGFEPRRIRRTVFAPFYSRFSEAEKMAKQVDPHFMEIRGDVLSFSPGYILSVHTDISTKHFNPSYESDGEDGKPNLIIEHQYFCADKRVAKKMEKYIPKNEIVVPNLT